MSIALLAVIVFAWVTVPRYYGHFSLIGAGLLGFSAYSVPAVVGLMLPVSLHSGPGFVPTSWEATAVLVAAWVVFTGVLLLRPPRHSLAAMAGAGMTRLDYQRCRLFIGLAALASIGLFTWIAIEDDPLFFLRPRETSDIAAEQAKLLWPWVNALGILIAVRARIWWAAALFAAFSFMYFVAGDRTMVAIVGIALAIHTLRGRPLVRTLLNPTTAALGVTLLALVLIGKPVYLAIKAGDIAPLMSVFDEGRTLQSAAYFEPFLTHYLLEIVIQNDFHTPLSSFAMGVVGQALVVPSMFGIDSSAFNVTLTERYFSGVTYGLAYNFWAQAYSIGGYAMVVLFACAYGGALRMTDRFAIRLGPLAAAAATLVGALLAIYAHRNSFENLLAFVRQILVVFVPLYLTTIALLPARRQTMGGAPYTHEPT